MADPGNWRHTARLALMKLLLLAATLSGLILAPASAQEDLGALALSLVNAARAEAELSALEPDERLADIAEAHAEDMLARGYYGHVAPEGTTPRDRFLASGGSRWRVVAENLATCEGCETPPGPEQLRGFQSGWMQSPGHRENILGRGVDRFGFGVASEDGTIYAVQMFAGPGTSPAAPSGEAGAPASAAELRREAADKVNAAREDIGQEPLSLSGALNALARSLADQARIEDGELQLPTDPFGLLPADSTGWTGLSVTAEACGGCGAFPAAGDGAHFVDRLDPGGDAGGFTHLGFALDANGSGRKIAVMVYGQSAGPPAGPSQGDRGGPGH